MTVVEDTGLALPAALVSHTATLQLPGPGTVTVEEGTTGIEPI